jgi:hypothetical protein
MDNPERSEDKSEYTSACKIEGLTKSQALVTSQDRCARLAASLRSNREITSDFFLATEEAFVFSFPSSSSSERQKTICSHAESGGWRAQARDEERHQSFNSTNGEVSSKSYAFKYLNKKE